MQLTKLEIMVHPAAIVLGGIALSFLAALAPTKAHAIQLLPLQVAAGLLPYTIFGMIVAMLRNAVVMRAGLATLAVHLVATVLQRGLSPDHGSGPLLVIVPLLAAVALMTLWPQAVQASSIDSGREAKLPEETS
mgnify:FL=1